MNDHIEVDVILDRKEPHKLLVRTDETSEPILMTRERVKIVSVNGIYATLSLPERTAINYNLI